MKASLFFDHAPAARAPLWMRAATVGVLSILLAGACCWLFAASATNWRAAWDYRAIFLGGWLWTLGISLAALALSSVLGVLLALARRSAFVPLRSLALVYIELVRGSPLLVQILFFWYVVAPRFGMNDRISAGILVLAGFSAAYIAEIVRSAIDGVGASQLESARAIGLTPAQTYRHVIFPQALRHLLAPLAGQFASLIKDSSLLYVVGIFEFTAAAQQVNTTTYSTLESYLPLGIGYLALTLPISALSRALEHRFRYET